MRDFLSMRLRLVAELVRQGAVFADVGTDHAYLPLFLLSGGKIERAICSDINEGPLLCAKEHAAAEGLSQNITFLLTSGLSGVLSYAPSDVAICGMGGELIAEILTEAQKDLSFGVHFLLQPMSKQEHLRAALCELGFSILQERYATEGEKAYLVILAEYTGEKRAPDAAFCLLGLRHTHPERELTEQERAYLLKKQKSLIRRRNGRAAGGDDTALEDEALAILKALLTEEHL